MAITHRIRINVSGTSGKEAALESGVCTLPSKLIKALFGDATQILVLKPVQTIDSVEVHEVKKGGTAHEAVRS